jgi:hypothetical protein
MLEIPRNYTFKNGISALFTNSRLPQMTRSLFNLSYIKNRKHLLRKRKQLRKLRQCINIAVQQNNYQKPDRESGIWQNTKNMRNTTKDHHNQHTIQQQSLLMLARDSYDRVHNTLSLAIVVNKLKT